MVGRPPEYNILCILKYSSYTQGIKLLDEASFLTYTARELYSSRAMAYTGRDQHEVAYYDACKACDIDANIITPGMLTEGEDSTAVVSSLDARALLRRARALYAMHEFQGSYETCRRALEDRCTTDDELIDTLYTLYQRAISRWFQSENGFYNWKAIRNAVAKGQIHNDIASYLKPIEVQNACGMGRGLFAKHNVAKGAMVLAEKAFAYAKGEPRGQETHIHVIYDLTRDAPEISAGEALLEKALTALQGMGPEWRSRFFELHSGGYDSESGESTAKAPTVDDQLIIDTFHVLSILRLNSMSCGPPHEPDRDSGIWVQASYVNHSCDPNCEIAFYGDMLVIRALRDIKVGEQITLNYVPMDVSNKKRREVLKASWAFDCGCGSCT